MCPKCGDEVDKFVEPIVVRCSRHAHDADVRHMMWLKIWNNNFGVDVYIKLASIDEELVLDILLGNYDIVNDVLARENVDCFTA